MSETDAKPGTSSSHRRKEATVIIDAEPRYEMAVHSVNVLLKRAFIGVTTSTAVVTKHLIVFLNQTVMKEHFCILLQHVQGASL